MPTAITTTIIPNIINLAIPLLEDEGLSTNDIHEIIINTSMFIIHKLAECIFTRIYII